MISQKKFLHILLKFWQKMREERGWVRKETQKDDHIRKKERKRFYPCGGKTTDFFGLKKAKQKPSLKSFSFLERERAKKCRFLQQNWETFQLKMKASSLTSGTFLLLRLKRQVVWVPSHLHRSSNDSCQNVDKVRFGSSAQLSATFQRQSPKSLIFEPWESKQSTETK